MLDFRLFFQNTKSQTGIKTVSPKSIYISFRRLTIGGNENIVQLKFFFNKKNPKQFLNK